MQTAARFQAFSLILFVWGLYIARGSDAEAEVYYYNSTDVDSPAALVPCTNMIHWSQEFSDKESTVDCHSRENPSIAVQLKTFGQGMVAYFNPLDFDRDSLVWECVARFTSSPVCCRFVAWAAYGHESEVCDGRESCHQCKWVGVEYDIAMSSDQCMVEDASAAAGGSNAVIAGGADGNSGASNISNMVTLGATGNTPTSKSLGDPDLRYCYEWKHEPC